MCRVKLIFTIFSFRKLHHTLFIILSTSTSKVLPQLSTSFPAMKITYSDDDLDLHCLTCSKPHNGSFGSGRFCGVSCSRAAGAHARWHTPKSQCSVERPSPDSSIELGLIGELVVVKDGKTVVRGCITEYDIKNDRHRYAASLCFYSMY